MVIIAAGKDHWEMLKLVSKALKKNKLFVQSQSVSYKYLFITGVVLTFVHKLFDISLSGRWGLIPLPLSMGWI